MNAAKEINAVRTKKVRDALLLDKMTNTSGGGSLSDFNQFKIHRNLGLIFHPANGSNLKFTSFLFCFHDRSIRHFL